MAGIYNWLTIFAAGNDDAAGAEQIAVVSAAERQDALSLLHTGSLRRVLPLSPASPPPSQVSTMPGPYLWAAYRRRRPIAAAMVMPTPGRTALLVTSPNLSRVGAPVAVKLIRRACETQNPREVRLIQALISHSQSFERQALYGAGFTRLADLAYMRRRTLRRVTLPKLPAGMSLVTWSDNRQELFKQAIQASYENTQDCPKLVGQRSLDDVIAGHMAVGRHEPALWLALERAGEPVGVMLLNLLPEQRFCELVYLGMGAAYRGRGLARQLLQFGLGLARKNGALEMALAVDEANLPAVRLYRSLRFARQIRKSAMMLTINSSFADV